MPIWPFLRIDYMIASFDSNGAYDAPPLGHLLMSIFITLIDGAKRV